MRALKKTAGLLGAAAVALSVAACAPVTVNASLERGMDFTHYRSYAWADEGRFSTGDPRLDNNEFFETRLQATADRILGRYGLEEVAPGSAALIIHYHANVSQRIDVNELDAKYGYCEDCSPSVYEAGTITLDFVDAKTNRLVWRGWSDGSLDGIDAQDVIEARVDEAVTKILAQLPPRL